VEKRTGRRPLEIPKVQWPYPFLTIMGGKGGKGKKTTKKKKEEAPGGPGKKTKNQQHQGNRDTREKISEENQYHNSSNKWGGAA